jgi:uncharacterized DUF497 family protein
MINIYPASWNILNKLLVKHKIEWKEVEEIFENKPRIFKILTKDQYYQSRYKALGQTFNGRYVIVIFSKAKNNDIKVITARDMDKSEKKQFRGR